MSSLQDKVNSKQIYKLNQALGCAIKRIKITTYEIFIELDDGRFLLFTIEADWDGFVEIAHDIDIDLLLAKDHGLISEEEYSKELERMKSEARGRTGFYGEITGEEKHDSQKT